MGFFSNIGASIKVYDNIEKFCHDTADMEIGTLCLIPGIPSEHQKVFECSSARSVCESTEPNCDSVITCDHCVFNHMSEDICARIKCTFGERKDHKEIVFTIV